MLQRGMAFETTEVEGALYHTSQATSESVITSRGTKTQDLEREFELALKEFRIDIVLTCIIRSES